MLVARHNVRSNHLAILISYPMFNEEPQLSLSAIQEHLASHWPDIEESREPNENSGICAFNIGDGFAAIGTMRAPFPWSDLEGPCATSILWPDSEQVLRDHKFHLIVTVSSDSLSAIELSILLTQVTASVMATTSGALGVYWGNATMVIPRDLFIEFATKILPQGPPVHIWVDFRVGSGENGTSSGFTTGLSALDLMEIEAINSPESVSMLRDRLTGLADYLITNGLIINDGDTVGEDENENIKVQYEYSKFGHEGKIISLNYTKAKLKKSRFKFW